jgi:hypothetical protein
MALVLSLCKANPGANGARRYACRSTFIHCPTPIIGATRITSWTFTIPEPHGHMGMSIRGKNARPLERWAISTRLGRRCWPHNWIQVDMGARLCRKPGETTSLRCDLQERPGTTRSSQQYPAIPECLGRQKDSDAARRTGGIMITTGITNAVSTRWSL